MAQRYEKSPRQRTEWFGGSELFTLQTSADNGVTATAAILLTHNVRAKVADGQGIRRMAFPAGIVRGESCSIARFIADVTVFDIDRRAQNVSYAVGAGLIKQEVEDDAIADPVSTGQIVSAPDPLQDLRASWLWHNQVAFNPQAAGPSYQHLSVQMTVDSTNSRIFESNDVLQFAVETQTLINSGEAVALNLRCAILWRALLRLD